MQPVSKGTAYIGIKQLIFLITGYAVHIGLGRLLGPDMYGTYTVTTVLLTIVVTNLLVSGIPQAVSKFISENSQRAESVKRSALEIQLLLGFMAFIVYFTFADFTSGSLNDPSLTTYIRLSSLMIVPFAILAVIATGYFNGLRQYSKQSISWIVSHITKPILIFTLVLAGYSVYGAVLGFALSPVIGLFVALYFAGLPKRVKPFSRKKILLFAIPVTVYTVLSQYITNIDLLLLKALTSFTDEIGYYSAASMISKVPVSLLAALNMAIFPAISETTYQNDVPRTQRYVSESLRYLLIFLLPSTLMIAISSDALVSLLYGQRYVEAGKPLSILIVGVFFFGLFAYFLNLIIASGKPRVATVMAATTLTFAVAFNFILIPPFGMVGAAFSTTLACLIGALISALYTYRLFGVLTSKQTFLKVLVSALAVIPVFMVKLTGLLFLMQYGFAFLLYFAVLKIMGELRKEDVALIRGVLK